MKIPHQEIEVEGESNKRMIRFTSGHFMYKVEGGSHYHSLGVSLSGSVRDVSGSRFFFRKKIYPTLSDIKIGAGSTVSGKY